MNYITNAVTYNIGRVREVAVPGEARVGAAGASAAAVTKAISAKGRRPAAANTLLSDG